MPPTPRSAPTLSTGRRRASTSGTNQGRAALDVRNDTLGRRRDSKGIDVADATLTGADGVADDESLAGVDVAEGGLTGADVADLQPCRLDRDRDQHAHGKRGRTELDRQRRGGPTSRSPTGMCGVLDAVGGTRTARSPVRAAASRRRRPRKDSRAGTYEVDFGHNVATCAPARRQPRPAGLAADRGGDDRDPADENDDPEDMTVHIHNAGRRRVRRAVPPRGSVLNGRGSAIGAQRERRRRRDRARPEVGQRSGIWGRPSARHARYCVGDVAGERGALPPGHRCLQPTRSWTRSWHSPTPEWSGFPAFSPSQGGTWEGHDGTTEWWNDLLGVFPDFKIEIVWVRDAGNLTVSELRNQAHGEGSAAPLDEQVWQVTEWRDGLVVQWQMYATRGTMPSKPPGCRSRRCRRRTSRSCSVGCSTRWTRGEPRCAPLRSVGPEEAEILSPARRRRAGGARTTAGLSGLRAVHGRTSARRVGRCARLETGGVPRSSGEQGRRDSDERLPAHAGKRDRRRYQCPAWRGSASCEAGARSSDARCFTGPVRDALEAAGLSE